MMPPILNSGNQGKTVDPSRGPASNFSNFVHTCLVLSGYAFDLMEPSHRVLYVTICGGVRNRSFPQLSSRRELLVGNK